MSQFRHVQETYVSTGRSSATENEARSFEAQTSNRRHSDDPLSQSLANFYYKQTDKKTNRPEDDLIHDLLEYCDLLRSTETAYPFSRDSEISKFRHNGRREPARHHYSVTNNTQLAKTVLKNPLKVSADKTPSMASVKGKEKMTQKSEVEMESEGAALAPAMAQRSSRQSRYYDAAHQTSDCHPENPMLALYMKEVRLMRAHWKRRGREICSCGYPDHSGSSREREMTEIGY